MVRGVEKAHRAYQKSGGDAERVENRARARVQNRPEQAQQASKQEGARKQHAVDRAQSKYQNRTEQPQKASRNAGARPQHAVDRAHSKYQDRAGQAGTDRTYSSKHGDKAQFSQKAMHAAANRMGSMGQPSSAGQAPVMGASIQFSQETGVSFGGKG